MRVGISHFTEAGLFLDDTAAIDEVKTFVQSLNEDARANYERACTVFGQHRSRLFDTRNKATFHYPALRPGSDQTDRLIRTALRDLGNDRGVIRTGRIRDGRALFADDVMASIYARRLGGLDEVDSFENEVQEGVAAFVLFVNAALDEYLPRADERGSIINEVEPVDPVDLYKGWKLTAR